MFEFLRNIWELTRPYRVRLMLGVMAGVMGGLVEPLMIAGIAFVYSVIFPTASPDSSANPLGNLPGFLRDWALQAQQSLSTGLRAHPGAIIALVAMIPGILVLRGVCTY